MREVAVGVFLVGGAGLMFVAALGIVRMPDLFTRMQATTKAATLGVVLLLAGAGLHFGELAVTTRVVAAAVFIMLTAPVAAHLLGRASYFLGVPQWEGSVLDDLRGRYNERAEAVARMDAQRGGRVAPGRAERRGAMPGSPEGGRDTGN